MILYLCGNLNGKRRARARAHARTRVRVCMYICMYVCMYVCMSSVLRPAVWTTQKLTNWLLDCNFRRNVWLVS